MSKKARWVDVDLSIVPDDQGAGLIEQPPAELLASYAALPWFDEVCGEEMVPRSEWKARAEAVAADLRATVAEIYSQGRTSACVGFGTAQAVETTLNRRYGRRHRVPLSGMDIYSDIGSTLMSGAYIPDGIARAQEIGVLPLRTPATVGRYPVTFPDLEYRWPRPSGWQAVARMFRVTKAAKVQGAEMIVSALLRGRCVIVGRKRHCVPYVYFDPDGAAAFANSWDKTWGDEGFGYDTEQTFRDLVGYVVLEVTARPDLALQKSV